MEHNPGSYVPAMNGEDTLDLTKVEDVVWFDVSDRSDGYMDIVLVGELWATAVVEVKFAVTKSPEHLTSFSPAITFANLDGAKRMGAGAGALNGIKYLGVIVTAANASDREVKPTLWAESWSKGS